MQNQEIKKLSPEKKLQLALALYFNGREMKSSAIKKFHPKLNEKEVAKKIKEIFLYAKS